MDRKTFEPTMITIMVMVCRISDNTKNTLHKLIKCAAFYVRFNLEFNTLWNIITKRSISSVNPTIVLLKHALCPIIRRSYIRYYVSIVLL